MRSLLAIIIGSALVGGSFGASVASVQSQHVRDLLVGIFQDVDEILNSFAGGPEDPKGPVLNPRTLQDDSTRLNSASDKARALATELQDVANNASTDSDGH